MEALLPTVYTEKDVDKKQHGLFDVRVPRYRFIAQYLGSGKRVLDVGCFTGYCSKAFQDMGNEVVGIDASLPAITKAKELYSGPEFYCIDAMNLTTHFAHGSFDVIVASEIIEHVLDPKFFLKQIKEVLQPGGLLILTTQNSNALHFRLRMLIGKFRWDFSHYRLYSKSEILSEVKSAGFDIDVVQIVPINPDGHSKVMRLFVYFMAKIYANFGWTICVVARNT